MIDELFEAIKNKASYEEVKGILKKHPEAIKGKNNFFGQLPLHSATMKNTTDNIIKMQIEKYPDAVNEKNNDGWLPLNYALMYGASNEIIEMLYEANPDATQAQDSNGRLPIYYALRYEASVDIIIMLLNANSEATKVKDNNGMLPLHVAILYNAPHTVVTTLLEKYPEALKDADNEVIKKLLFSNEYCDVKERFKKFLEIVPEAVFKIYYILHELPKKEKIEAALNVDFQSIVKEKLGHRIPTFILMFDFYVIVAVITCFGIAVIKYNKWLFGGPPPNDGLPLWLVIGGGVYFLLREAIQAWSFHSIGFFMTYIRSSTNLVDIICIILMFVWPILMLMECGQTQKELFRSLSTVSTGFLFLLLFSFLRRISKDFAIFVKGLITVAKQLITFLAVLVIFITAFALMFYSMFIGTCEPKPFDSFGSSWFEVYNMILGNYQSDDIFPDDPSNCTSIDPISYYQNQVVLYLLYILLGILAFVILLNVLIAVVVETYGAVRVDKSEVVYWTSRLEFAFEMGILRLALIGILSRFPKCLWPIRKATVTEGFFYCKWKSLTEVFDDERSEDNDGEFIPKKNIFLWFLLLRVFAMLLLVIWFMLGAVSAGLLWPSQVRQWLWESSEEKDSQKKTIQEIKRVVTSKDNELTLEVKLNSKMSEINDVKQTSQEIERIKDTLNLMRSEIRDVQQEMSEKTNQILELLKNTRTEGSITGDYDRRLMVSSPAVVHVE